MNQKLIYLASASPRRQELLQQLGVNFELLRVECDESVVANEVPEEYVKRLAVDKARAGLATPSSDTRKIPVLGADTAVVVDNTILGKPVDQQHAHAMLSLLSNREHRVLSAVALVSAEKEVVAVSESRVRFAPLTDAQIAAYWRTGEPADKAGAYGIQGLGAIFIENLSGSYTGVMGLPLFETAQLLKEFNIHVLAE